MSFTYKVFETEEEAIKAKQFPMLEYGEYDFMCVEADYKVSQNGNPMIALKLKIEWDDKEFFVYGNLIGTDNMVFMTKHFCEATRLEKEYMQGIFNESYALNKRGRVMIGVEDERPNPKGGVWKAKNKIIDFVNIKTVHENITGPYNMPEPKPKGNKTFAPTPAADHIPDDDIPF
jgi:hypothetical protein